jgi:ABC-type transport system involved in multi-copper enzyme maturation permease subunit
MTAATVAAPGVTQTRVLVSEWIKFRSLRSTWFSFGAVLLASIGLGILFSALRGHDFASHHAVAGDLDPTEMSLRGTFLAQLAVGVLGVLTITGEYSTGMIRASLSAVPRRTPVLVGKIVVFAAATFVICTAAALVAFLAGQAALSHYGYGVSLTSTGAARAVVGAGLYLALVGLLALGCGFALRNTGGAIATLFGLILVLPLLAQALPSSWQDHVEKYLPLSSGTAILATHADGNSLGPWTGLGVFAIYVVVALTAGFVVLRRRDA